MIRSESGNVDSSRLPPATALGPVHLFVGDLGRSIAFYTQAIGLDIHEHEPGRVAVGVGGTNLVVLHEEPGVRPSTTAAGLFHLALRVPTRAALAGWLRHAAESRLQLTGLSDHFVSEAIYLNDPDAHGIEIYWDRPRDVWEGQVGERLTTMPLDTTDLMGEIAADEPLPERLPAGTDLGHIHLRVGSLPEAVRFYDDLLGFDTMARIPEAAFLSVGGYHHQLGLNTWHSRGASAAPVGFARIKNATIIVPDSDAVAAASVRLRAAGLEVETLEQGIGVLDPSGTAIVLAIDDSAR